MTRLMKEGEDEVREEKKEEEKEEGGKRKIFYVLSNQITISLINGFWIFNLIYPTTVNCQLIIYHRTLNPHENLIFNYLPEK